MLTFDASRAWHPSLWPFYALRSLTLWAAIGGAAFGVIYTIFGGPPGLLLVATIWASFVVLALGFIPAVLLTLLDAALVGRRNRLPNRSATSRSHPRPRAQSLSLWPLTGAGVAAATLAGYAFVYLNAFAPSARSGRTVVIGSMAGAGIGLVAGWLTATVLNLANAHTPSRSIRQTERRAAFIWAAAVIGMGIVVHVYQPSFEVTVLPTATLAILGAAVVPQLAAKAPLDRTVIPTPSPTESLDPFPTASSPDRIETETSLGGEARAWRHATPPRFPRETQRRPSLDAADDPTEVVNG